MVYLLVPAAYLLGSIPFGLLLARWLCGVDPRQHGSGNIGATNVTRLCGARAGAASLLLDMAKGYAPSALALHLGASPALVTTTALAALLGHVYSVFLDFKGGKAVATTLGVFAAISPLLCLLGAAVCVAGIALSGYVSVGSLLLAASMPVILGMGGELAFTPLALAVAALIVWRHRENIARLRRGEETSWRKKKDPAA